MDIMDIMDILDIMNIMNIIGIMGFLNIVINGQHGLHTLIVPHSQSGAVPISSLLGVGQLGFWEFGRGGSIG
jgi:hypothetical protein